MTSRAKRPNASVPAAALPAAGAVVVYRIAADASTCAADDRLGKGAASTGGRWNSPGRALLYTAASRALACLETFGHLMPAAAFPMHRDLMACTIPTDLWAARTVCDPVTQIGWDVTPPGLVSIRWGDDWLASGTSLVAEVPSVVVPEECCVLLNPAHPDMVRIQMRRVRRWRYAPRMLVASLTRAP